MNHDEEIHKLHRRQTRTKFVIVLIIGFMALLTYLLISISKQIAEGESMDFRSRASEYYGSSSLSDNEDQMGGDSQSESGYSLNTNSRKCGRTCEDNTDKRVCLQDCGCGWFGCPGNPAIPEGCHSPGTQSQLCQGVPTATPTLIPIPTAEPPAPGGSDTSGCNAVLTKVIRSGIACNEGISVKCVRNNGTSFGSCDLYAGGANNRYACLKGEQKCSLGGYCEGQFIGKQGEDLMKLAKSMCCGGSNGNQPKCSFF